MYSIVYDAKASDVILGIKCSSPVFKLPSGYNNSPFVEKTLVPGSNWIHERTSVAFASPHQFPWCAVAVVVCDWSHTQCVSELCIRVFLCDCCMFRFFIRLLFPLTSILNRPNQTRAQGKQLQRRGKNNAAMKEAVDCVCVRVCVRVCLWEKEREPEEDRRFITFHIVQG